MGELTASDVLAMTRNSGRDGFLEGNGIIILILFFLMFGGFGGYGGNGANSAALQGSLTRAELYDGLNMKEIESAVRGVQQGLCDGFYAMNTSLLNGFAGVQRDVSMGFAGVARDLCSGFNGVNANINQLGYNMQDCCCQIKNAIHAEGETTRALFTDTVIQNLRDKLADKDRENLMAQIVASQALQTNNLEGFIRSFANGCC